MGKLVSEGESYNSDRSLYEKGNNDRQTNTKYNSDIKVVSQFSYLIRQSETLHNDTESIVSLQEEK